MYHYVTGQKEPGQMAEMGERYGLTSAGAEIAREEAEHDLRRARARLCSVLASEAVIRLIGAEGHGWGEEEDDWSRRWWPMVDSLASEEAIWVKCQVVTRAGMLPPFRLGGSR